VKNSHIGWLVAINDSQGDYCLNPISYTDAMQSNEQKQWIKAMNEELALLKENET
jgi:hypothetical protein